MVEKHLDYFAKSITNYFESVTGLPAEVGIPFLQATWRCVCAMKGLPAKCGIPFLHDETLKIEYSGLIGISGKTVNGYIYFAASKKFASNFAKTVIGDVDNDTVILDTFSEIANTISGNAQEHFDSNFIISVPRLVSRKESMECMPKVKINQPIYIIPILWNKLRGYLVLAINEDK